MKTISNIKTAIRGVNKFGIFAILIAGLFAFSFKAESKKIASKKLVSYYWYHVNPSTNETFGSAAYNDTKENVVDMQDCKDDTAQPICLYGSTNPSLAPGTNVGSPAAENRILRVQE